MKVRIVLILSVLKLYLWGTVGFVVNSGSETLSRINFTTGEVDNVFSVLGSMPNRVALSQDFAYVVNSGDNNIQKINLQTGDTEELIFIGLSTNPYDIIIDEDWAIVSGGLSNKLYKIDLLTDEIVAEVNVGNNPAGMAIYGEKLYVGNTDYANFYANCSVSVIDLQTFTVTNTLPTEVNPQFLAVINNQIHISCGGDWGSVGGKICILNPTIDEIIATIELGGVTSNFAETPAGVIYVGDGFGYNLYAYESTNFSVIYDNSNPFTPGGTMVATDDNNLFVLGGEWGQNFTVKKFDFAENLIDEYTVALYATDLKLMPEQTEISNQQIANTKYHLSNYPNPFNPVTTISFTTEQNKQFELSIYNLKGQKIRTFIKSPATNSSQHQILWDGTDIDGQHVSSGVYLYQLKIGNKTIIKNKMTLIK